MVIMAVTVARPMDQAEGVKEILAIGLEALGAVRVVEIREAEAGVMLLTLTVDAPVGSGAIVRRTAEGISAKYRDTKIVTCREEIPAQMEISV